MCLTGQVVREENILTVHIFKTYVHGFFKNGSGKKIRAWDNLSSGKLKNKKRGSLLDPAVFLCALLSVHDVVDNNFLTIRIIVYRVPV